MRENNGYVVDALLGRSLDHEVVVLNGGPTYMQRYDASTDRFGAPQSGPFSQVTPVLDSTGQTVAFDLDIYDDSLRFLRHAKGPVTIPGSVPTVLSADGSVLYEVLWYGNIVRSRVSDGAAPTGP